MNKTKYLQEALKLLNEDKISVEAYDSIVINVDIFAEEEN